MIETKGNSRLLDAHRALDAQCRDRRGRPFLGDWYCENPFLPELLGLPMSDPSLDGLTNYYFQNDDPADELHTLIRDFHSARDEYPAPAEVFVGAGMSPLLTAQMAMLKAWGHTTLHYVRPLYYSYYYLADLLGIQLLPVNGGSLADDSLDQLRLPQENVPLLICCPRWFMGKAVPDNVIDELARWQSHWGAPVFVDGAFQYMRFRNGTQQESTASFDPELTLRSVCPTKAVVAHGVRFSYSLLPGAWKEDFRYAYASTSGSGCRYDDQAGRAIMRTLTSATGNRKLLQYIAQRREFILEGSAVEDCFGADSGYFGFVRPTGVSPDRLIMMGPEFFDVDDCKDFTRVNWLMSDFELANFLSLSSTTE